MKTNISDNKLNGWLIVDKPCDMSSARVVAIVKRHLKAKKIGHGGTLDPFASGVLPLAIGEATKTVSYAFDGSKEYIFTAKFGEKTDTDDCTGSVIARSDVVPSEESIKKALPKFVGDIEQVPPIYSAIKVDGKRAYKMAREGEEFALKSRIVKVDSLELLSASGSEAKFKMICGKGTYVRAIVRDMAEYLGSVAHVTYLRRTKVGKFSSENAILLEDIEKMLYKADLVGLMPVEFVLDDIPVLDFTKAEADMLKQGKRLYLPESAHEFSGRFLVSCAGVPVAIAEYESGFVKPVRVFNL